MAECCAVAFGRYLRTLRERRGLSLDDVGALSRTFPDPVTKSYLSRVENGHISLALPKMIPLSRIYEIPPEVILQRLELDLELDKVGGPDTQGLDYTELTLRGKGAVDRGATWEAYAYFRDSAPMATCSPLMGRLRDHTEQFLCAFINISGSALKLGRSQLALHELQYIHSRNALSARVFSILLERLSTTYHSLGDSDRAREYADQAIAEAERIGLTEFVGYFYSSRARVADHESKFDDAVALHQRAFQSFREAEQRPECALTLSNLAQTYIWAKRYKSARRALAAAERLAAPLGQNRTRAFVRLLLGQIEELEGKSRIAEDHWREALALAKRMNDKIIRFQVEYFLYRQAVTAGHKLAARSLERRLLRASAWLPHNLEELDAFKRLHAVHGERRHRRVAQLQPSPSPACNSQ